MKSLNRFKDKRVLILGFAREGIDTFRFLRRIFPRQVLAVADQAEAGQLTPEAKELLRKDKNHKTHFGKDYLKAVRNYDIVVKSPGIPPRVLNAHLKKGQVVTSQTEIFFENCSGKIIGVTGTKGKSTTAALIYDVLKTGKLKTHLVGNIGQPVLTKLFQATNQDVFVYELSSHQLMSLKRSPHIAIFLNLYPEHLDYYQDIKEYLKAKQNICRWQRAGDYFLFNPNDPSVKASLKLTLAQKLPLDIKKAESFLAKWGQSKLAGFYLLNIAAAIETGRLLGVKDSLIAKAIRNFKPLAHRLKFVGSFKGIKFYNDSLATIPEATMAAIDSLGPEVETIFLGGFDRGLSFEGLAQKVCQSQLKNLIFFPTTGLRIWQEIQRQKGYNQSLKSFFVTGMEEAVKLAFQKTKRGKICLLSCASPSFGLFKDYRERGDSFKKFVRQFRGKKRNEKENHELARGNLYGQL